MIYGHNTLWRYFHLRSTRKLQRNITFSRAGRTLLANSDIVKIGLRSGRNDARYREAKLSVETKINTAAYAPTTRSKMVLSPRHSLTFPLFFVDLLLTASRRSL